MNEIERYEFDRQGFIVIKNMLPNDDVVRLGRAVDRLEKHAIYSQGPRRPIKTAWGGDAQLDLELGYHLSGKPGHGNTIIIEDFWNADSEFDFLIGHERTMSYINEVVQGRVTINNSELRIRYTGNSTISHMGGPIDRKYRYACTDGRIDCMMVRMIYFIHDIGQDDGPFSVVPATHKSNFRSPYSNKADDEPGMMGLCASAGDAILFTENLRHGGLTVKSAQTRRTLHVGYGPHWLPSQNASTADQPPFLTDATRARLGSRASLFQASILGDSVDVAL